MSWSSISGGDKGTSTWANLVQNALGSGYPAHGADYTIFYNSTDAVYEARNGTDGTIDSTDSDAATVMQAAHDACSSTKGGTLYLHPNITWSSTVTITNPFTAFIFGGRCTYSGTGYALVFGDGTERLKKPTLINPWIMGTYSDYTTGSGIQFNSCTGGLILNPHLAYFSTCINLKASATNNCVWNSIVNPIIRESSSQQLFATGISITRDGSVGANANTIWGGIIADSSAHAGTIGVNITGGDTNKVFATDISTVATGVYLGDNATYAEFWSPRLESVTTGFQKQSSSSSYHQVHGGTLSSVTTPFTNFNVTDKIQDLYGYGTVYNVEHHTAADTLTRTESGSTHTNLGATGNIKLTLPQDAVAGTTFQFAVMTAAQQLQVDAGAAGALYINGAKSADDAYIWADDEGESVKLVADGNGDWVALYTQGTWTVV